MHFEESRKLLFGGLVVGERQVAELSRGEFQHATAVKPTVYLGEQERQRIIERIANAANGKPKLGGYTVLVPFTVTIPAEKRDPRLAEKLRLEGPAILRWAIDGAREWQRRGLDVPARVAAASTEYLDGEDVLGQFLADETVRAPGEFLYTTDLHQRFKQWTDHQGLASWTSHTLTKEMKSRGFPDDRRSKGRGFFGIKLTR